MCTEAQKEQFMGFKVLADVRPLRRKAAGVVCALVAATLPVTGMPMAASAAAGGHWAEGAAGYLASRGLIAGAGLESGGYDAAISHSEFRGMFERIFGAGGTGAPGSAGPAGAGHDGGVYDPEAAIKRQEMFAIVGGALMAGHGAGTQPAAGAFADMDLIDRDAMGAIGILMGMGIIQGYGDSTLRPQAYATRAEAMALLARLPQVQAMQGAAAMAEAVAPAAAPSSFESRLIGYMPDGENYVFSPFSIKMAMAMAANGAGPEAREEIMGTLGIADLAAYNRSAKSFIESNSETLRASNSIWMNADYFGDSAGVGFAGPFKGIVGEYYKGAAEAVRSADGADIINRWISQSTEGKIENLVTKEGIDNAVSFLVNAVYFKNRWLAPFEAEATRPGTFADSAGPQTVPFMHNMGYFKYYDGGGAKSVMLYFEDFRQSMVFVLPDANGGPIDINGIVANIRGDSEGTYVDLKVPKFEIRYTTPPGDDRLSLKSAMKGLGATSAFMDDRDSFPHMYSKSLTYTWIEEILHAAYIKVDENGAEAAAVTAIEGGGGGRPQEPVKLYLDRPFLFMICDEASGEILFVGGYSKAS
jgi:serpin B